MPIDALAIASCGFGGDVFSLAGLDGVGGIKVDPKDTFGENESNNWSSSKGPGNRAKLIKLFRSTFIFILIIAVLLKIKNQSCIRPYIKTQNRFPLTENQKRKQTVRSKFLLHHSRICFVSKIIY